MENVVEFILSSAVENFKTERLNNTSILSISIFLGLIFIICIIFTFHDSGRSSGDKTIREKKEKKKHK